MPATAVDPSRQIHEAVAHVRKYRHQDGCRCFSHVDTDGERYCSYSEALWSRAVNRLITDVLAAEVWRGAS